MSFQEEIMEQPHIEGSRSRLEQAQELVSRLASIWWLVGVGALLRLATLGRQSIWLDEAVSYWTVNRPFGELLAYLSGGFRTLYFLLLYPMAALGGDEWMLRLPSALAGIASIFLVWAIGRELFDERTGLLAALFVVLSPLHVWYSQEARFYALVGLLALSAVYFAVRALRTNHILDWVLFGLFEAVALWTETAAVWFVLSLNLAALLMIFYLFREGRFWGWAGSQVLAGGLFLPGLFSLAGAVKGGDTLWIPPATFLTLMRVLSDIAGAFMRPRAEGVLALLLVGAGLLLGLRYMLRESRRRFVPYLLVGVWLVVPFAISFAISQPYYRPALFTMLFGERQSIFLTRNLITTLFPLALLLSRSLLLIPRRAIGVGVAAGLMLLYVYGTLGNTLVERKEDYRSAGQLVSEQVLRGDLVLTSPGYIEQPFAFYYFQDTPYGLELESVRDGVVESEDSRQDSDSFDQVVENPLGLVDRHDRVWFVTNANIYQQADANMEGLLTERGELVGSWESDGVRIQLYNLPGNQTGLP